MLELHFGITCIAARGGGVRTVQGAFDHRAAETEIPIRLFLKSVKSVGRTVAWCLDWNCTATLSPLHPSLGPNT